jgi:hypothetical protein
MESQGTANIGTYVQDIRSNPYNPTSYEVVGGELRLEFKDLMLRYIDQRATRNETSW